MVAEDRFDELKLFRNLSGEWFDLSFGAWVC